MNLILLRTALRQHGLSKVASAARALRREESPLQDTLPAAAACIGTKLAAFRLKQASTQAGLDALEAVLNDPAEKTASDHVPAPHTTVALYPELVRTEKLAAVLSEEALAPQRLALWNSFKAAAYKDPEGPLSGLAKLAIQMWAAHEDAGYKTASFGTNREALATSFASALLADIAAEKLAEEGHLDATDLAKLASLNAESALEDLHELTKHAFDVREMAGRLGNFAYHNPEATGALALAPVGAALGAWDDKDNRLRGAVAGGAGGAALGAVGGHAFRHYRDHSTQGFREGLDAFDAASAAYHAEQAARIPEGAVSEVAPGWLSENARMRNEGAQSAVDPGWFSEKTRMRNEGAQSAVDPGWLSEKTRMRNEGAQSAVDPGWFSEKTRMRNEGAQSAVDPGWLSESARPRDTTGQPPGYIPQGTDGPDMNAPQIQKFKARQEAQKRLTAQNNASPPPTAKTAPEPAAEEPSGGALAALLNKFNKPRP